MNTQKSKGKHERGTWKTYQKFKHEIKILEAAKKNIVLKVYLAKILFTC